MSQMSNQAIKSFIANNSVSAYTVLAIAATAPTAVIQWNTVTAFQLGIAQNNGSTGDSIAVAIGGTSKILCAASVSVGSLVGPNTVTANLTGGTGQAVERGSIGAFFTTTSQYKYIGIALQSGSTNSVIEVLMTPSNISGA